METYSEIILIRHGKADPRDALIEDAQRKLTGNGIRDLEKMMPALIAHLGPAENLRFCSSPLLRALETAQIIADHIKIETIEQQDWIATGDFSALTEKRKNLEPNLSLVITGHEPSLSEWSNQLSGYTIPFRKGTAVGFRVLSTEPLRAEPKWIVMPETVDPDDLKIKRNQPALQGYQKILRVQLHDIFDMLQKFLEAPQDPESAHQYRVKIRTFRSVLTFIKPLLPPEKYQTVQDRMRTLAQLMGYLREIDVLQMEWVGLLERHPNLIEGESMLTNVLTSERDQELAKISDGLAEKTLSTLFDVWNWVEDELPAEPVSEPETEIDEAFSQPQSFRTYSEKRFNSWKKKAIFQLKSFNYNEFASVHAMRIRCN